MGQKVHPYGFRLGVVRNWRSTWYSSKDAEFAKLVAEDFFLRKDLKQRFTGAGVASIDIERAVNKLKIVVHTSRPGVIIGRKGAEIDKLKLEIQQKNRS